MDIESLYNIFSNNRNNKRNFVISAIQREVSLGVDADDVDVPYLESKFDEWKSGKNPKKRTTFNSSEPFITQMLKAQSSYQSSPEKINLTDIVDVFRNQGEDGPSIGKRIGDFFKSQILEQMQQEFDLHRKINEETSLTGELSRAWRREIMEALPVAEQIGYSFEELSESMATLIKSSGRFKLLSTETIENLAIQSRAFFDNLNVGVESLEEFQKVSMGASDAMKVIEGVGLRTLGLGLNAKTTVKTIVDNLEKVNQYGFKNGIEGLSKMTRQAQSLRFDLTRTLDLAEKVMDPDKALSLASELQVIGGALGDFNDPIKMMWMATNNVEGLQDAIVKSAESLVTFEQKSGTFKIIGADLRRARAMSEQLGMSLGELSNLAVQSAQRTSASYDLMLSGIRDIDEDDKEFLTNLSQMKDGKMTITIPETLQKQFGEVFDGKKEIPLIDLSQKQYDILKEQKDAFKKMSSEDIILKQVGLIENINRDVTFIAAKAKVTAASDMSEILKGMGVDQNNITKFTRDLFNQGANLLVQSSDFGMKLISDGIVELKEVFGISQPIVPSTLPVNNKQITTQSNTTPTTTTSETKHVTIEMIHKPSGNMIDSLWRAVARDSDIMTLIEEKEARAYTNAN